MNFEQFSLKCEILMISPFYQLWGRAFRVCLKLQSLAFSPQNPKFTTCQKWIFYFLIRKIILAGGHCDKRIVCKNTCKTCDVSSNSSNSAKLGTKSASESKRCKSTQNFSSEYSCTIVLCKQSFLLSVFQANFHVSHHTSRHLVTRGSLYSVFLRTFLQKLIFLSDQEVPGRHENTYRELRPCFTTSENFGNIIMLPF